jgi:hypothetical protein
MVVMSQSLRRPDGFERTVFAPLGPRGLLAPFLRKVSTETRQV